MKNVSYWVELGWRWWDMTKVIRTSMAITETEVIGASKITHWKKREKTQITPSLLGSEIQSSFSHLKLTCSHLRGTRMVIALTKAQSWPLSMTLINRRYPFSDSIYFLGFFVQILEEQIEFVYLFIYLLFF